MSRRNKAQLHESFERKDHHVYADLRDGLGMRLMTLRPISKRKADAECQRLTKGETRAARAIAVRV